jgi:hypothetical protein
MIMAAQRNEEKISPWLMDRSAKLRSIGRPAALPATIERRRRFVVVTDQDPSQCEKIMVRFVVSPLGREGTGVANFRA